MVKIVLVGHPASQRIRKASEYLVNKYLPAFDVTFLNYKGPIEGWARYVSGYLRYLTDTHVIFALDDYLISSPVDMDVYEQVEENIGPISCVKLCECSPEEHKEYPCTTQYSMWDREFLISLLDRVRDPWEFEVHGSKMMSGNIVPLHTCFHYFTNSSLSSRWEGVRLDGLNEDDINYIKEHGLIN